jgi:hypothetical protein
LRYLIVFITCLVQLSSCAQADAPAKLFIPAVSNHLVSLGDTLFTIQITIYDSSSKLAFVHVHDDEQTAKDATHNFLERYGGTLVSIQNNGERLIRFPYKGKSYTFDPNRMFTRKGIMESLKLFQPYNTKAVSEIERFANFFFQKIPANSYVIAMHNNTDNKYSVRSYLPKGILPGEAAKVYISKNMDPDDFVLTTDPKIFTGLQKRNISVILQKKKPDTDDGSLSILFGRKKKAYTNVEAEHGHFGVQLQLVEAVADIVNN